MRLLMGMRWFTTGLLAMAIPGGCYNQPSVGDTDGTESDTPTSGPSSGPSSNSASGGPTDPSATNPTDPSSGPDPTDPTDPTDPSATDTTGDTTGAPMPCEREGGVDPACADPDSPFCIDGACTGCDGAPAAACATLDPTTPFCDAEAGTCVGCNEHDQCESGACRIATGECFAESNRLWVDGAAGNCAQATGTMAAPFCDVVTAMEVLNNQVGTDPWAIFVAGSPNPYTGTIDPDGGRPVAIIGPSQGLAAELTSGSYTVDLWAQSPETYLSHLTISGGGGQNVPAIRGGGNSCDAWIDDSAVTPSGLGILTGGCTFRVRRTVHTDHQDFAVRVGPNGTFHALDSAIFGGQGGLEVEGEALFVRSYVRNHFTMGGIEVTGSLTMVNSMMWGNEYNNRGINVTDGGEVDLLYSTIIGGITCTAPGPMSIRNSIVLGSDGGQACGSATVDYSVVNVGVGQGAGNVLASTDDYPALFVDPSIFGGDFHLLPGATIPDGVAVWDAGDPLVDIDQDARPAVAGTSDWAGADVP